MSQKPRKEEFTEGIFRKPQAGSKQRLDQIRRWMSLFGSSDTDHRRFQGDGTKASETTEREDRIMRFRVERQDCGHCSRTGYVESEPCDYCYDASSEEYKASVRAAKEAIKEAKPTFVVAPETEVRMVAKDNDGPITLPAHELEVRIDPNDRPDTVSKYYPVTIYIGNQWVGNAYLRYKGSSNFIERIESLDNSGDCSWNLIACMTVCAGD